MQRAFTFWWRLSKLQRELRRTTRLYEPLIATARQKRDWDGHDAIVSEAMMERDIVEEQIAALVTQRLLFFAHSYLLLVPPSGDENWAKGDQTGAVMMTREGMAVLRTAIREEEKHRSALLFGWLAGLTGLVGAITGAIALALRH